MDEIRFRKYGNVRAFKYFWNGLATKSSLYLLIVAMVRRIRSFNFDLKLNKPTVPFNGLRNILIGHLVRRNMVQMFCTNFKLLNPSKNSRIAKTMNITKCTNFGAFSKIPNLLGPFILMQFLSKNNNYPTNCRCIFGMIACLHTQWGRECQNVVFIHLLLSMWSIYLCAFYTFRNVIKDEISCSPFTARWQS